MSDPRHFRQRLRHGHRPIQDEVAAEEQASHRIRSYVPELVPGLLQCPEYARVVFRKLATLRDSPRDTEDAVRARLARQRVLTDPVKHVEVVFPESVLRQSVVCPTVVRAQIDYLLGLVTAPSTRWAIIPAECEPPVVAMQNFHLYDDYVSIELSHTEVVSTDPEDIKYYQLILDQLWTVAVDGEAARALLRRVAADMDGR